MLDRHDCVACPCRLGEPIVKSYNKSSFPQLIAKLLVGMAVGVSQVVVTPYVTEVAPNRCRGAMIAVGLVW